MRYKRGTSKSPKRRKCKSSSRGILTKPSNSIEIEVSSSGVRKLKQTHLNFECYKSKGHERTDDVCGDDPNAQLLNDENKFGEDDVILDSPRRSPKSGEKYLKYDFAKNHKNQEEATDVPDETSGRTAEVDPDETFVSSMMINEREEFGRREIKTENYPSTAYERSPEYNSVPFPYQDSPVRKRSERMKLPGQTCMECSKYYKAVLGEIDPKKLQQILNQCSRHRKEHYNVADTPPGYWKPYLTETFNSVDATAEEEYDS